MSQGRTLEVLNLELLEWLSYRTIQFSMNLFFAIGSVRTHGGFRVTEAQNHFFTCAHVSKFKIYRGCSSVGRAVALQAIGQEFDPPQLHQPLLARQ